MQGKQNARFAAADIHTQVNAVADEMVEVERLVRDDVAASEMIVGLESGIDGGDNLKFTVTQVLDITDAIRMPCEGNGVASPQLSAHIDAGLSDRSALYVGFRVFFKRLSVAPTGIAAKGVERVQTWFHMFVKIPPEAF